MTETTLPESKPKQAVETLILKPSKGWVSLNLGDLWRYRELAFFLTWRDVKVRYKQTALGAGWAVLQPLMQMVIFTFLFGRVADVSTGEIPRPIFTFSALLPWNLFAKALTDSSRSLVSSRNMITKVYFPRLVVPMAPVFGGLVDFAIGFLILIGMMIYYQVTLTPRIWAVPLFIILALINAFGVGLWFSAWNLHYRDVGYFIPSLTQFMMLASPIGFPLSKVPEQFQLLYAINPMVGVVEGFRWALLDGPPVPAEILGLSLGIGIIALISGMFYFRRMERTFADMV